MTGDGRMRAGPTSAFARRAWQEAFDAFGEAAAPSSTPTTSTPGPSARTGWVGPTRPSPPTTRPTGSTSPPATAAQGRAVRVHARHLHPPAGRAAPRPTAGWPGRSACSPTSRRGGRRARLPALPRDRRAHGHATSRRRRESARRMQDLGRRFGDDTLVALGVVLRGPGPASSRRGSARGSRCSTRRCSPRCRTPEADVDRCDLLRAARRVPRAGRPPPGPRVDRGDRASGASRCPSRRCTRGSAACTGPRSSRLHGAWDEAEAEALGACRTWPASTCSWWPTAGTRSARSGGAAATWPVPRRPTAQAHEIGRDPQPGPRAAAPRAGQGRRGRPHRSPRRSPASAAAASSERRCSPRRSRSRSARAT